MTQKKAIETYVNMVINAMESGNDRVKFELEFGDIPKGFTEEKCNRKLQLALKKAGFSFDMENDTTIKDKLVVDTHIPTSIFIDYSSVFEFFLNYGVNSKTRSIRDEFDKKTNPLKIVIPLISYGEIDCKYKNSLTKMLRNNLNNNDIKLTYRLHGRGGNSTDLWMLEIR